MLACRVQLSGEDVWNIAALGLASNGKYVPGVETRPARDSKLLLHVLVTQMYLSIPSCTIAWHESAVRQAFGEPLRSSLDGVTNLRKNQER